MEGREAEEAGEAVEDEEPQELSESQLWNTQGQDQSPEREQNCSVIVQRSGVVLCEVTRWHPEAARLLRSRQ